MASELLENNKLIIKEYEDFVLQNKGIFPLEQNNIFSKIQEKYNIFFNINKNYNVEIIPLKIITTKKEGEKTEEEK